MHKRTPPEIALSPARFFDEWLADALNADPRFAGALADVVAELEVSLRSDEGSTQVWHVALEGGKARVLPGPSSKPSCIIKAHVDDWRDLLLGDLRVAPAMVDGRLRVSGDASLATRLVRLLF